ncbi:hypothetical protein IE53DRAFT_391147 [Violaceomyces palustris]|uniref:Uncharacterized protein n=1 Tax=Violaceomyces palustris TaxID=1673888 RepID=A0ACD0NLL0_9BASI|nr:hypothetical protein IE53DRAFT_391147 [Violaceomyces palustris]
MRARSNDDGSSARADPLLLPQGSSSSCKGNVITRSEIFFPRCLSYLASAVIENEAQHVKV